LYETILKITPEIRIFLVFQQHEVVPLYGDMLMYPYNYVKQGKNYVASKWPSCEGGQVKHNHFPSRLGLFREDHVEFVSQLMKYSKKVGI